MLYVALFWVYVDIQCVTLMFFVLLSTLRKGRVVVSLPFSFCVLMFVLMSVFPRSLLGSSVMGLRFFCSILSSYCMAYSPLFCIVLSCPLRIRLRIVAPSISSLFGLSSWGLHGLYADLSLWLIFSINSSDVWPVTNMLFLLLLSSPSWYRN